MESHIPIPFPGSPVVSGESLTPTGNIGLGRVPGIQHNNFFSLEDISGIEPTDSIFKRSNLRHIQHNRIAVGPINAPKSRFRMEEPQCHPLLRLAFPDHLKGINISKPAKNLPAFCESLKLDPLVGVIQSRFQYPIV